MEDLSLRFPLVARIIFNNLDDESLTKIGDLNRPMNKLLDQERIYWLRILRKYQKNFIQFKDVWKISLRQMPVEVIKELAIAVNQFFNFLASRHGKQWSPLHIAAERGLLQLYQYISNKTGIINHGRPDESTALHLATQMGNLEIVKFIIDNLVEKASSANPNFGVAQLIADNKIDINPRGIGRLTPLHVAAQYGHIEIFKTIAEVTFDKNLRCKQNFTPLHEAAYNGHLEVCKLLLLSLPDKNPRGGTDEAGITPLHFAAHQGHSDVVKLFFQYVNEKNVVDAALGFTPLHYAALKGHLETCKILMEDNLEKNPADGTGWTPLHLAAKQLHLDVCREIGKHLIDKNPKCNYGITPLYLIENAHIMSLDVIRL